MKTWTCWTFYVLLGALAMFGCTAKEGNGREQDAQSDGATHEDADASHGSDSGEEAHDHGDRSVANSNEHDHDEDEHANGDDEHGHDESAHGHDESAHDHAEDEHGHEEGEHADQEGRVTLSPNAVVTAGIAAEEAGPHELTLGIDLPGEVVPNADRLAHIVPRFAGIAREVKKSLGDPVRQDETLALVESNESLSPYEVRSLISGIVIEKHITLGEFVRDDEDIFVVADLSTVWIDVTVYARDLARVEKGLRAEVTAVGGQPQASGRIDYIAPALGEATRAASARVVLANPKGEWRPGMFVTARIIAEAATAGIAIPTGAIQRLGGRETVFIELEEGSFQARTISIGRSDGEWTEVTAGLDPGERYVTRGGFILKSELMKSEAGHQH